MTLDEMTERVLHIVQDDSFEDGIPSFINQGIRHLGMYQLTTLDAEDTVDCSSLSDNVPMPDDYLHGLYSVYNGKEYIGTPAYYDDYARFLRYNPDRDVIGKLYDCAVRDNTLLYTNREDVTLTLRYFQKPSPLTSGTDEPTFVPEFLHEPILVNFAAWNVFNLIEDGVEDPKTNTKVYQSLYAMGLQDLQMFVVDTDQPMYIQDEYVV